MLETAVSVAAGLVLAWIALVIALIFLRRSVPGPGEMVRLLPDVLRLLRRLASDPSVPRSSKLWLWLLLAYLASPIDLVPDFIPVLGYLDDAILVAAVLRWVVRRAGHVALRRNWPGSEDGLRALMRTAGIAEGATDP